MEAVATESARVVECESERNDSCGDYVVVSCLYTLSVLQSVFGTEPSDQQLDVVLSDNTITALAALHLGELCAEELRRLETERAKDRLRFLETLKSEYTQALIGPGALSAPPWESVYESEARLLFSEGTLEVRRSYLAEGVKSAGYPHEPDDHLVTELNFLEILLRRRMEAVESGDKSEVDRLTRVQTAFLDDHLLRWTGSFARQLDLQATGYFSSLGMLAERFLSVYRLWLDGSMEGDDR